MKDNSLSAGAQSEWLKHAVIAAQRQKSLPMMFMQCTSSMPRYHTAEILRGRRLQRRFVSEKVSAIAEWANFCIPTSGLTAVSRRCSSTVAGFTGWWKGREKEGRRERRGGKGSGGRPHSDYIKSAPLLHIGENARPSWPICADDHWTTITTYRAHQSRIRQLYGKRLTTNYELSPAWWKTSLPMQTHLCTVSTV